MVGRCLAFPVTTNSDLIRFHCETVVHFLVYWNIGHREYHRGCMISSWETKLITTCSAFCSCLLLSYSSTVSRAPPQDTRHNVSISWSRLWMPNYGLFLDEAFCSHVRHCFHAQTNTKSAMVNEMNQMPTSTPLIQWRNFVENSSKNIKRSILHTNHMNVSDVERIVHRRRRRCR